MPSKTNYKLTEKPFIIADNGDVIGIVGKNGRDHYFPAGSADNAITASTGSTQATGVRLNYRNSRITVCANIGDAVTLPKAIAGYSMFVMNSGANSADVFPAELEQINALGADAAFAMATVTSAQFVCMVNGLWNTQI